MFEATNASVAFEGQRALGQLAQQAAIPAFEHKRFVAQVLHGERPAVVTPALLDFDLPHGAVDQQKVAARLMCLEGFRMHLVYGGMDMAIACIAVMAGDELVMFIAKRLYRVPHRFFHLCGHRLLAFRPRYDEMVNWVAVPGVQIRDQLHFNGGGLQRYDVIAGHMPIGLLRLIDVLDEAFEGAAAIHPFPRHLADHQASSAF